MEKSTRYRVQMDEIMYWKVHGLEQMVESMEDSIWWKRKEVINRKNTFKVARLGYCNWQGTISENYC